MTLIIRIMRWPLRLAAGGVILAAVLFFAAWGLAPGVRVAADDVPEDVRQAQRAEMDEVRAARLAPEGRREVIVQEVDYSQGKAAAWYPKGEAPVLQRMVAEGELPPVEERVGPEPVVMRGVDGIGTYGGTWHRLANSAADLQIIQWRLSGATMVRWSPEGGPLVPHIAKSWEVSDDYRIWTFHLRKGMRWSDGHPFTANDVAYFYNDEVSRFASPVEIGIATKGIPGKLEVVDDYTFRLRFEHPFGTLLNVLSTLHDFAAPRHYLQKFHPDLGDKGVIARELERRGLQNPRSLYGRLKTWQNPEHPRLWPWIYRTYRPSSPQVLVRNPYFFAVDPEGNQLPYMDEMAFREVQSQLIAASAARGHASMQFRHLRFSDYTLLMAERERGGYEIRHFYPATRSIWSINPNLNRAVSEREPDSRMKADLLRNVDFRRALSLAIDRRSIINALYNGVGDPSQLTPGEGSRFHHPEGAKAFTEFDPNRANALLDGIGLTKRDSEGFRTFPDGRRMTWFLSYNEFTGAGPAEFVKEDWARVGIRLVLQERSRELFTAEWLGLRQDFTVWVGEGEFDPVLTPRSFVPVNMSSMYATAYGRWFSKGGFYGTIQGDIEGGAEPEAGHPLRASMQALSNALAAGDPQAQVEAFRPALDIAAENVWTINISSPPPELVVVDKDMGNVPPRGVTSASFMSPSNLGMETYFFKNPRISPAAQERLEGEIREIVPMPGSTLEAAATSGERLASLITNLIWISLLAGLIAVGVRHPFIGRRLMIMVPTLFIVSIVTFTIIQLPPSDYLQVRLTQLELQNDQGARAEIAELREVFHLDRPMVERYLRWLGVYWFFGFHNSDRGLLQGNMGRSMETNTSVNELVGDRILLTVVVSVATILFTWLVALPIGIYSAVRQYSFGDYVVTILGFLGMCIPNFLLALILIFLAKEWFGVDAIGLFSPEFATQAHWDWPKVQDMLEHIWLPVVVLGVGGTAGMIRVMRGNLLDELRRPYVTTARAKGVRPLKLLLKYPVRLALNPFISGIGAIFPQIVSGGAIVAIVLSLPMVGPLMLTAMMSQDTYLAGSMLMVLSLLGIMGTLVSDLLLLWLDPRIRMEGGGR